MLFFYIRFFLCILFIFLITTREIFAQHCVFVSDNLFEQIFPLKSVEFYEDDSGLCTFGEISSPEFQHLFKLDSNYSNFNYRDSSVYWLKFRIHFASGSEKKWLLEFYDQTIDNIEADIPNAAGVYR